MSDLSEALEEAGEDEAVVPASKLHEARLQRDRLQRQVGRLQVEATEATDRLEAFLDFSDTALVVPEWLTPKTAKGAKKGVATLLLSDTHFDEVVDPAEVEGLNAYNRDIATIRLENTFKKSILMTRDYVTGVKCESAVIMLGGDMVTGTIHDELAQTNDAFITETVLYWTEQLCAGIYLFLKEYGRVHVLGVVGNHGRLSVKPRHKGRVKDNWDWLIYHIVAREFKDNPKVTFQISESADTTVPIYDFNFRLTHGDQFRGGSGQAGVASPASVGDKRKRQLAMASKNPYDYLVMGHWHSYMFYNNIIVNNSTKGYDEYAYHNGFQYSDPGQAFWITTPEHGVTFPIELKVMDRKAEKW